jgi:20S proteasome subunit beta 5
MRSPSDWAGMPSHALTFSHLSALWRQPYNEARHPKVYLVSLLRRDTSSTFLHYFQSTPCTTTFAPLLTSRHSFVSHLLLKMDALVAQYSRQPWENEGYSRYEQQELTQITPPLSLRFALPQLPNVCIGGDSRLLHSFAGADMLSVAFGFSSSYNRRPREPKLSYQACPWHNNSRIPIPRRYHSRYRFKSFGGKLDCESDSEEGHRDQQLLVRDDGWRSCCMSTSLSAVRNMELTKIQDCQFWLAYLGMQCRLHELRHKRRISVAAASKILANLVYSYKGMGLSMGTMCAGVTPQEGPALYYIDSDGTRLAGNLFCVGSGQTFAYGVLDAEYRYDLSEEQALELGRRSILAATHRDAFSGGYINLYHVKESGWVKHGFSVSSTRIHPI